MILNVAKLEGSNAATPQPTQCLSEFPCGFWGSHCCMPLVHLFSRETTWIQHMMQSSRLFRHSMTPTSGRYGWKKRILQIDWGRFYRSPPEVGAQLAPMPIPIADPKEAVQLLRDIWNLKIWKNTMRIFVRIFVRVSILSLKMCKVFYFGGKTAKTAQQKAVCFVFTQTIDFFRALITEVPCCLGRRKPLGASQNLLTSQNESFSTRCGCVILDPCFLLWCRLRSQGARFSWDRCRPIEANMFGSSQREMGWKFRAHLH